MVGLVRHGQRQADRSTSPSSRSRTPGVNSISRRRARWRESITSLSAASTVSLSVDVPRRELAWSAWARSTSSDATRRLGQPRVRGRRVIAASPSGPIMLSRGRWGAILLDGVLWDVGDSVDHDVADLAVIDKPEKILRRHVETAGGFARSERLSGHHHPPGRQNPAYC